VAFTPSGPRAWLDEHCEWALTRNAVGRMMGVNFTCESAVYFLVLWRLRPQAVLGLYRKTIDPVVRLEGLYLRHPADGPMVPPTNGTAAPCACQATSVGRCT
jgi:hypothetical protein